MRRIVGAAMTIERNDLCDAGHPFNFIMNDFLYSMHEHDCPLAVRGPGDEHGFVIIPETRFDFEIH